MELHESTCCMRSCKHLAANGDRMARTSQHCINLPSVPAKVCMSWLTGTIRGCSFGRTSIGPCMTKFRLNKHWNIQPNFLELWAEQALALAQPRSRTSAAPLQKDM
eukprot:1158078-Pelagomonas_calceolata.AAC.6